MTYKEFIVTQAVTKNKKWRRLQNHFPIVEKKDISCSVATEVQKINNFSILPSGN